MLKPIRLEPRSLIAQIFPWMLIVNVFLLVACAGPETKIDRQKLSSVETILVLPFHHIDNIAEEPVIIDCEVCPRRHAFEVVAKEDAAFMSMRLMELLYNDGTHQYIFHDHARFLSPDLNHDNLVPKDFNNITAGINVPRGVDAVLVGYIFRFRERVGKSYGIESPASVAFSLVLIKKDDGQVAWHSHYQETQEALFSNLLTLGKFIKRKGRWITARELATGALEDMLSTLIKP